MFSTAQRINRDPMLPVSPQSSVHQGSPLVQCFHVNKSYAPGNVVFTNLNLRVFRGDCLVLAGGTGSGKTTLLKLLTGSEPIDDGHILFEGNKLQRTRPRNLAYLRRRIGVVFEDFRLLPRRSVFDNIALPLEVLGMDRLHILEQVYRLLLLLDLENRTTVPCARLSGGEKQRVALARAVIHKPDLLLADTPLSRLDEDASRQVIRVLRELHQKGTTMIVTDYDHTLSQNFPGSRRLTLHQGRLEEPAAAS